MSLNENKIESKSVQGGDVNSSQSKSVHDGTITQEVLESLRSGDHNAYQQVYLQWRKPIYNLLHKLTGSDMEAEDITQDVFIALWENRSKIDPTRNIKSLLYLVARNSAIKYFDRKKARDNYVSAADPNDMDSWTSYEIIVAKETELLKEVALSRMPRQRRIIYELSDHEGLSAEQIAERLNISRESVYNQLSIARKDLKELIAMFLILFVS